VVDKLAIGNSFWRLIEQRATDTPSRPYLSDDRGRVVSFGDYHCFAEEVAAGLVALGMGDDDVVSWQLPTTIESAVLLGALSRLSVRQNPVLPILGRSEVSFISAQVKATWIIVPGTYRGVDFAAMVSEATAGRQCRILSLEDYIGDAELSLPRGAVATLPPYAEPSDPIRWYYYSSGTTAHPKGAKHTDASVMASSNAQIAYLGLESDDLIPVAFPITHIGGIMLLTSYARAGAQILLLDSFDPTTSPVTMAEHGATVLGSATPFFHAYLAAQKRNGDAPLFTKLRQLQAGGAPITPELNAECVRVFGARIYNQWGLTEFPAATSLAVSDEDYRFEGTVGRPAPGVVVKAVDPDGITLAPGVEGELLLQGPQCFGGYLDQSLDASAFDADGFFRSGDLGTVDSDGFVRITGRIKDIIIRNAENISALEIEETLVKHPSIADCAVIGIPDDRTGERACAVIVLAAGASPVDVAELSAHCRESGLAKQKAPEQIVFVDVLPRNPMGKVLKHVLRSDVSESGH
jgi:cyclohexanecarboxylate-CoA ligase